MLTAANETTKRSQEIVATGDGALRVDPSGCRYSDLGLIVDAANVAAGATLYSGWIDSAQWVRRVVIAAQCDKAYSAYMGRRDTALTAFTDYTVASGQSSAPTWWRVHEAGPNGPHPGYGIRFGIKNDDGSNPASYARLRVQLMGS